MPGGNKKIGIDIGVDFKVEGQQLDQYVNKLNEKIQTMQNSTGNSKAFSGTQKAVADIIKEFDKLSHMKLNNENVGDYIKQQDKLRQAIEEVNRAKEADSTDLISKQEKYNKTLTDATRNYEELAKKIKEAKDDGKKTVTWKDEEITIEKANNVLRGYLGTQSKANKNIDSLNNSIRQQKDIQDAANHVTEQANKVLRENTSVLDQVARAEAEANKENFLNAIKRKIQYYTSLAFGVQLVRKAVHEAINTYQELDKSITSISMVSGLSRDTLWGQIDTYNDLAKQLGTTTGEVLNAAQLYYQQGRDTNSVIKLTTESLQLAAIAGLETADATNYLTAAVNGYKMNAADAGQVTDVWAQLAAKNAVSVKELSVSISKVASIAQSAGMDIQSTSAFLTQMIATTREAPENLGTALKTIIARFQELKTSPGALEDGVDANKVEKALKTVGISLRDATGQFRDFDDVILELSSIWNTLDRNTQRYIATIAAGSRQQSRFIALVSDYEGLTKVMDQAANAQGAADEQFETYTEGLQAALNRLKASWEGFYTNITKGQNIITSLINLASKLIGLMDKIGIVGTGATMAIGGALTKHILSAFKIAYKTFEKSDGELTTFSDAFKSTFPTIKKFGEEFRKSFDNELFNTGTDIGQSFAKSIDDAASSVTGLQFSLTSVLGVLAAVAAAVAVVAVAYKVYRNWEKKPEEWREESQNSQQVAKRYEEYADSIEEAVKAGQDWSDIRERLLSEDEEFLKGLDAENASTKELIQNLRDRQKEEELLAITKKAAAQQEEANRQNALYNRGQTIEDSSFGQMIHYENPIEKSTENLSKNIARDLAENVNYIDAFEQIKTGSLDAAAAVDMLTAAFVEYGVQINENTGEITGSNFNIQGYIDTIRNAEPEVREAFYQLTAGETTWYEIDEGIRESLTRTFTEAGFEDVINTYKEAGDKLATNIKDGFAMAMDNTDNGLTQALLRGFERSEELSPTIKKSIAEAFNNIDTEDPEMQNALADYIRSIMDIDPALLTQDLIDAFSDMDFEGIYSQLLNADESPEVNALLENIKNIIGDASAAFIEGKQAVDDYNSSLSNLNNLTSGTSLNEYADSIWALSADWEELGFETREAMLEQLWANTVIDESGQYMQAESDILADLRNKYDLTTAEARKNAIQTIQAEKAKVDAKIKEIEAELEARGITIEAARDELKAAQEKEKGTMQASVAGHRASAQAVQKHGAVVQGFINRILNPLRNAAKSLGISVGTVELDDFSTIENEAIDEIMKSEVTVLSNAALAAMFDRLSGISAGLAHDAMTIDWYRDESAKDSGKTSGSSPSSSSDKSSQEAEKISESMEKAAKAAEKLAKEMQNAAKVEIDAIKTVLEARKKEEEEKKKANEEELADIIRINKRKYEETKKFYDNQLKEIEDNLKKKKELIDDDTNDLKAILGYINDSYDEEIAGIQDTIDALEKEAEAEDRLLKLQKARDEYERARNQRTRLVLTRGAGWIFKTDTEALNQARTGLKDAQRDYQKATLQDQIDKIKDIKNLWSDAGKDLGKNSEEIQHQVDLMNEAKKILESGDVQAALALFGGRVASNKQMRDDYATAEKVYEQQSDETVEGTLAWRSALYGQMADDVDSTIQDREDQKIIDEYIKNELKQNVPEFKLSGDTITAKDILDYSKATADAYNNHFKKAYEADDAIKVALQESIALSEEQIKSYDESLAYWSELQGRIGKSAADLALVKEYEKKTNDELSSTGAIAKTLEKTIGDHHYNKDRYDTTKTTGPNAWYKAFENDVKNGVLTMTEETYWAGVLAQQQADQKAAEDALTNNNNGNTGNTGNISGAGVDTGSGSPSGNVGNSPSGNRGSTPPAPDTPSSSPQPVTQGDISRYYANTPDTNTPFTQPSWPDQARMGLKGGDYIDKSVHFEGVEVHDKVLADTLTNAANNTVLGIKKSKYGTR